MVYWRSGDYAGVGPGAHGRLTLDGTRVATSAHLMPGAWLSAVEGAASGDAERERLSNEDRVAEMLLMGLRLREGVDLGRLRALGWDPRGADVLVDEGWLTRDGARLAVTAQGWPLLNAVLERLLTDQPPERARSRSSSCVSEA